MVLPEIKEVKHICMPRLEVNGKSPRSFVPTLIHIAGSVVENPQHWNQTIGSTVSLEIDNRLKVKWVRKFPSLYTYVPLQYSCQQL